jgi:hypothetical protein
MFREPYLPVSGYLFVVGVLYPTHKQVVQSELLGAVGRVWLSRHGID